MRVNRRLLMRDDGSRLKVYLVGFAPTELPRLENKITIHGGLVVSPPDNETIVLCQGSPEVENASKKIRVDWLYQCIDRKKLIDPDEYVLPPSNDPPAQEDWDEVNTDENHSGETPPQANEYAPNEEQMMEELAVKNSDNAGFDPPAEEPMSTADFSVAADIVEEPRTEHETSVKAEAATGAWTVPQMNEELKRENEIKNTEKPLTGWRQTEWRLSISSDDDEFVAAAHEISIPADQRRFSYELEIAGKMKPAAVWTKISKLKEAGLATVQVVRIVADHDEKLAYTRLYEGLRTENRLGIAGFVTEDIRDFYVMPYLGDVPEVLMPVAGLTIEDAESPTLLAVILRHTGRGAPVTRGNSEAPTTPLMAKRRALSPGSVHGNELNNVSLSTPHVSLKKVTVRLSRLKITDTPTSSRMSRRQPTPSTSSGQRSLAAGGGVRGSSRTRLSRHPAITDFSEDEEHQMIDFLIENDAVSQALRKPIWRRMAEILGNRTASELHEHFVSVLRYSYSRYVDDSKIELFDELFEKSQRPKVTFDLTEKKKKRRNSKYTEEDNRKIVQFLVERGFYNGINRHGIWMALAREKIVPHHTVNSVKSHYNQTLKKKLAEYIKDPQILAKCQQT